MTPYEWPASLPCFRFEPYAVSPREGALQLDLGQLTHRARVYDQTGDVVSVEVVLIGSLETTFRNFYKTTLAMGTQSFTVPIWIKSAFETREAWFVGPPPVFTPVADGVVKTSFSLLTREILGSLVYELTASQAVNIDANSFGNSATQPPAPIGTVVTISTNASDRIVITKPAVFVDGALTWDAWSAYNSNALNGGLTWGNVFFVSNQDDEVVLAYSGNGLQATDNAAWSSVQPDFPIQLSGHTEYTFWCWDTPIVDNRGGLSLRVETYSIVP